MIPINKEELIKQYIDYKISSYKTDFSMKDILKLDRVEKILKCHGWLSEAEKAFKKVKDDIDKRRDELKNRIVEAFEDYEVDSTVELEQRVSSLKEDIKKLDRFGYIRVGATEEIFKEKGLHFIEKARILMKLGEVGL